ncbi:hypothetical protein NUW58_g5426 [Xylaria curta]|uniref:Uncharacterized protein n=1 Tax=Xylaria curta TaxID=42375 RepID=A0ACC1P2S8_9PEZI|nr:hypothetical protein NUW58_g5426 [Xylaria curta]
MVGDYLDDVSAGVIYRLWPDLKGQSLRQDFYSNILAHLSQESAILTGPLQPTQKPDIQQILEHLRHLGILKRNVDNPLNLTLDHLETEFGEINNFELIHRTWFLIKAWLTVELETPNSAGQLGAGTSVGGGENATLRQIIEARFQELIPDEGRYGWTVIWTSDLAKHLTVDTRAKSVAIYEHKICLLHHSDFGKLCPIPQEAIREALDTLNVLFPPHDLPTQRYLKREGRPFYQLGSCNRKNNRDLANYRYWHEGLAQLRRVLDEEPIGLSQFVFNEDRRNIRNITTFWLAVVVVGFLTFGFGIISSVFAAKAYQVALMQYDLQLAQTCYTFPEDVPEILYLNNKRVGNTVRTVTPDAQHGYHEAQAGHRSPDELVPDEELDLTADLLPIDLFFYELLATRVLFGVRVIEDVVAGYHTLRGSLLSAGLGKGGPSLGGDGS